MSDLTERQSLSARKAAKPRTLADHTLIYLRFLISDLRFTRMKRTLLLVITCAVLAGIQFVAGQEMHPHMHEHTDKLGQVNFRTSCSHEAQTQFNHAGGLAPLVRI